MLRHMEHTVVTVVSQETCSFGDVMVTTREEKVCKWGFCSVFFFFVGFCFLHSEKNEDFSRYIDILRVEQKTCVLHIKYNVICRAKTRRHYEVPRQKSM